MRQFTDNELAVVHSYLLELLKAFKTVCDDDNIWYTLGFGSVLGAVRHHGFIPWDSDADVCIKIDDVQTFREGFRKHHLKGIKLNDYSSDYHNTKSHDTLEFEVDPGFPGIHLDIYPLIGASNNLEKQSKVWRRNYFLDRFFRTKYNKLSDCLEENRKKVFFVKLIDRLIPDSFIRYNIRKREREFDVESSDYLTCLASPYKPVPKRSWDSVTLMPFEDTEFYVPGNWDLYLKSLYGDYMTPRKY